MIPASNLTIIDYPLEFFFASAVLLGLMVEALIKNRKPWAIPAILVYGTTGAWYLANLLQIGPNDSLGFYGSGLFRFALMQVTLFLIAYRLWVRLLLPVDDDPEAKTAISTRISSVQLHKFFVLLAVAWLGLFIVGLILAEGDFIGILWPPSREFKVGMFTRPGVGTNADFLIAAAGYIYLLVCALFAVVCVLARGLDRWLSLGMLVLTWPYFWFDRARNIMLALLLPAVFCYWIAHRDFWWRKAMVTLLLFGFVNFWFLNVLRSRDREGSAAMMMNFSPYEEEVKHLGLDMLSELCWMDYFIDVRDYSPNMGQRYLAEVANVIPRTIWPNKPMIGNDYAILRGFGGNEESDMGTFATIATGMIGGGVANFGPYFGVIAAALLMALWTKVLVNLWKRRFELLRLLLFLVGCGLTFNMGRDITLLVLWPFVFGYIFVLLIEKYLWRTNQGKRSPLKSPSATSASMSPAQS